VLLSSKNDDRAARERVIELLRRLLFEDAK
jgi:hypothetical protein